MIQAGAQAGGALHLMDLTWGAPTLFVTMLKTATA